MGRSDKSRKSSKSHQSSKHSNDGASSSGYASSSAPGSVKSQLNISRHDGPGSPTSTSRPSSPQAKSPGSGSPKSPPPMNSTNVTKVILGHRLNYDIGGSLFGTHSLPTRPKATTKLGQDAKVALNTYKVNGVPSKKVYQFEVMIGNGVEKRGLVNAVWNSQALKAAIGPKVIFDGDRLAWSLDPLPREVRLVIDLDRERGKTPRAGKENIQRVVVRQTNQISFTSLVEFMAGKTSFNTSCLEAINCLDHVMREYPSRQHFQHKRSFYPNNHSSAFDLTGALEAVKGAYQSIRPSSSPQGPCLTVNVDVSNGTFWRSGPLLNVLQQLTGFNSVPELARALSNKNSKAAKDIKRLQKKKVVATHRKGKDGKPQEDVYSIDKWDYAGARNVKFMKKDANGVERSISVFDHFRQEYGRPLQHPDLPLVKTSKGAYIPIEVLKLAPNQLCKLKLNEFQTRKMIEFAVTPPNVRGQAIQEALQMLNWQNDPILNAFDLKISTQRTVVPARVLTAPKVCFGAGGTAAPGTSGRWDLKGKKFLTTNTVPLKAWGVVVIPGARGGKPDKTSIENFIKAFVQGYANHGGKVETKLPPMILASGNDVGDWVTQGWNKIGQTFQQRPQMVMFILPDKNMETYQRIKRSMDCRFGCVSQCVQYAHAQKCQPQYISNVLMKFNAKLGGTTCRAMGPTSGGSTGLFKVPTVIIGADVSHAAPGMEVPSCAAITVSMDQLAVKYAATVENNGYRVEMIQESTLNTNLKPLLTTWAQNVNNGKPPQRIIYIRDGVSEAQYAHVLEQEVPAIRKMCTSVSAGKAVEIVVIIAQKRHQIRFFPERGDRNGNPLPGTLVETGATHPFENDFYLCAHAAIKGTARPVHYQVILNDANMSNDEIYTLLYEHSYQYLRATTPVSIHPAVYYAHLASNRGIPHDKNFGSHPDSSDGVSRVAAAVAESLMPMPNEGGIRTVPWFI